MSKIKYDITCPHTKEIKSKRGDFVTEGNHSYFRVEKVFTEIIIPCGEKSYIILDEHPFTVNSGIDPLGIKVQCKGCGKEYYLFGVK